MPTRKKASLLLAATALLLMSWPAAARSTSRLILVPTCSGGFHPLDIPSRGVPGETAADKACHSVCLREHKPAGQPGKRAQT